MLYQSGYTKSQVDKHVEDVMLRVLLDEVDTNGYALFEPAIKKAQEIVRAECKFVFVELFSMHTEEERAELKRQHDYYMAFKNFEERKTAKAKKKGLKYHQISKDDRKKYSIPPEIKSWIITKDEQT